MAAVKLERAIGDPHRFVGRKALCHGGEMRLVRRAFCHLDARGIKEGARSLEPRFHVGKGEPGRLESREDRQSPRLNFSHQYESRMSYSDRQKTHTYHDQYTP